MTDYSISKAWPYVEARRLAERNITGRPAVFQCGYGPSGLPHVGTFAEVQRTTWVRHAYEDLMGFGRNQNTRLIVFSDDMDALRKVPDNVPNRDEMEPYVGYSLSRVPFGRHESFAHMNNMMLRDFLDRFKFDYEFMSASQVYASGAFNAALSVMWDRYDAVRNVILPTIGVERQATYSPFMPILADGRVIMSDVEPVRHETGLLGFPNGDACAYQDIYDGRSKLGWKADWALRWYALGIDYEMAGKDLIDSVALSTKIVRLLGGRAPVNMIYEMFLDEQGQKISKSKGNGLTIEEWLQYGTPESLSAYLYRDPKAAKKLHHAVVPQAMDDYNDLLGRYVDQTPEQRLGNPVHHVHGDAVPEPLPISYQLVLNVAQTAAVDSKSRLHSYACRVVPMMTDDREEALGSLINGTFNYYEAFLAGKLTRRDPTEVEAAAMLDLADRIERVVAHDSKIEEEQIQFEVYEVGKEHFGKENLRDWFRALYEVLMGQSSGPRFGQFAVLYGIAPTVALLREAA